MRARTGREKHYHFARYYYMHKSGGAAMTGGSGGGDDGRGADGEGQRGRPHHLAKASDRVALWADGGGPQCPSLEREMHNEPLLPLGRSGIMTPANIPKPSQNGRR